MSRGPKTDFVARARGAWGDALPDWVEELAREANRTTGAAAAIKLGYTGGVVSAVIANNYKGDLSRVEGKVRGALMGATVNCPVVGEIGRDRCLDEQSRPFSASSAVRAKFWRECRSGCPHSRLEASLKGSRDG